MSPCVSHSCESFLSLAALGLLTRMREIASVSGGYLRIGRNELTPESLVAHDDRVNIVPILAELVDFGLIQLRHGEGRRYAVVVEYLEEEDPPERAVSTSLRSDGYMEWSEAYKPSHEWNCPSMWDKAIASGWDPKRIVSIARWYSLEQWRKNEKRMRTPEFFRRLSELEKAYLNATKEERDGKAMWQQEALALFKQIDQKKETKAA